MSPTNLGETTPTARKNHRCSLCTGPIRPSEKYYRATLIYDERIYDWLTCRVCVADRVLTHADRWSCSDDGVDAETAHAWACEQARHGTPTEQDAAKRFLQRTTQGGEA